MKKLFFVFVILTIDLFSQIDDNNIKIIDLKKYFGNFEGGFSIYNFKTNNYQQYNTNHCKKRFSPCSTFKIPNSLIGLETGVIKDTSFVIKYDSTLHPNDEYMLTHEPFKYWFLDLSLKSAFKYSSVWYYQEMVKVIGDERMNKYLSLINYGNKDISSGLDRFWLCGSMQISINEQIEFLKKLYNKELPGISDKTINAVKDIMLYASNDKYKLYGKTGSGDCSDDKVIGWYIGIIETETETYVFAMNILVNDYKDFNNNFRIELTKNILKELKIIN